jgi:hypothetical protein
MAFGLLSNPVGWAVILGGIAAAAIWYFRDDLARAWPKVVEWFKGAWTGIKNWALTIDWKGVGMSIADSLTFGLASKFAGAIDAINARMPSAAPAVAGARARGGPVRAGGLYLVGEEGPELFRAPQSGRIVPAGRTAAMFAAAAMTPMAAAASPVNRAPVSAPAPMQVTINVNGAQDPRAIAAEVRRELNRLANKQSALLSD